MHYLILALATWRISSLLVNEDGPWQVFTRLRSLVGVRYGPDLQRTATNGLGELFDCVWCMSVWIGITCTVAYLFWPAQTVWILTPLALSAGAIVIERVVR